MAFVQSLRTNTRQTRSFPRAILKPLMSTNKVSETNVFHSLNKDERHVGKEAQSQATPLTAIPATANANVRTAWQDYRESQEHQIKNLSSPLKAERQDEKPSSPVVLPFVEKLGEIQPCMSFKQDREMQARSYRPEEVFDGIDGDLLWYKHWLGLGINTWGFEGLRV